MSQSKLGDMADRLDRMASAMAHMSRTMPKVEVVPRPVTDAARAQERARLGDRKEVAALKKRLGL